MPTFNECVMAIPEITFGKSGETPVIKRIIIDVVETKSPCQELTDKLLTSARKILAIS